MDVGFRFSFQLETAVRFYMDAGFQNMFDLETTIQALLPGGSKTFLHSEPA